MTGNGNAKLPVLSDDRMSDHYRPLYFDAIIGIACMKPPIAGDIDANSESYSVKLTFPDIGLARQLFGEHNGNLQKIARALEVRVNARGNTVFIAGEVIAARLAENLLTQLYELLEANFPGVRIAESTGFRRDGRLSLRLR